MIGKEGNSSNLDAKRSIMDIFWKLADPADRVREDAVVNLVSHFSQAQKVCKGMSTELDYTLNRLVGGLASSRKAARLGFFVALVEMLKHFDAVITVDCVMNKIEQQELGDNHQVTKADSIGHCLGLGSLIRSGLVYKDSKLVLKLLEEFLKLASEEKSLAQFHARFAVELVSNVEPQMFHQKVWPKINHYFEAGWKSLSPDMLWIFINMLKHLPDSVKQNFLSKYFGISYMMSEEGLSKAALIFMESVTVHSCVHPLYVELLKSVVDSDKFEFFWKCIISGTLGNLKKERTSIAFNLVQESLPCLVNSTQVKIILCPQIVDQLIRNLLDKSKVLHSATGQLVKYLVNFVKESSKPNLQFAILKCLVTKPGSVLFDEITRTKTVYQIIQHLSEKASRKSVELLKDMFYETESEDSEKTRFHILKYISYHLQCTSPEHDVDILQFLILHSYFNQIASSNVIPQCDRMIDNLSSPEIHKVALESLNRGLITILKKVPNRNCQPFLKNYCKTVADSLQYVITLLQHPEVVLPVASKVEKKAVKKLLSKVQIMDKKTEAADNRAEMELAFQMLILHLGMLLLEDAGKISLIEDVYTCHENAFLPNNDETNWVNVLVDVLLGILSEDNQLLRTVACHVFVSVMPHLTVKALEHVLDVIDPTQGDSGILGEDDWEGESESDSDPEDDMNEEVDDQLRTSVKEALGDAVAKSDDESETYLEDDDMFMLDEKLAAAFQMMSKKRSNLSNEEETLMGFRTRCLDLISIVVKCQPKVSFLMPCLMTLTKVIDNGLRSKSQNVLTNRAMTQVNNITSIKKILPESNLSLDFLPNVLKEIVKRLKVTSLSSNVCSFVVRCAMLCDKSSNQDQKSTSYVDGCSAVYKEWLREFFTKKGNFYQPQLFSTAGRKCFAFGWQLVDVLLEFSLNAETRLFQRKHGVTLLKLLTSKQLFVFDLISKEEWETFSRTCFSRAEETMPDLLSSEANRSYCLELLSLLQNIVRLDKRYKNQVDFPLALKEALSGFAELNRGHVTKEIKKLMTSLPVGESDLS